jgi:hypothetical protein
MPEPDGIDPERRDLDKEDGRALPRGARGNGLSAADWVGIGTVPPHASEELLAALADAGIAAYVLPTGAADSFTLQITKYAGPADRLFVDVAAAEAATRMLEEANTPAPPEPIDDDTWAGLIAAFEASPDAPTAPSVTADSDGSVGWEDIQRRLAGNNPASAQAAANDEEDHFVPPPPPPLPEGDSVSRAAWAGVIGAPVFAVLAVLTGVDLGGWPAFLLAAAFLGGFATLVVRMGDRVNDEDNPDDGAVV